MNKMRWLGFLGLLSVLGIVLALPTDADAAKKKKKKGPDAAFKKLDSNNDSKISKEEFAKIAERRKNKGKPVNAARIEKRFGKLDTNSDGSVSLDELKAGAAKRKKKKADAANTASNDNTAKPKKKGKGPEARFQRLDANKDGKVSKEEFNKLAEIRKNKGKEVKEGKLAKRFGKLDANSDGSVSLDEFKAGAKKKASS